jgi:hypothetical protein
MLQVYYRGPIILTDFEITPFEAVIGQIFGGYEWGLGAGAPL